METAGAKLQPRYSRDIAASPEAVLQALRKNFSVHEGDVRMEFRGAHVQVSVPPTQARWWSPWLTLEVEPRDGDLPDSEHAHIVGRFGSNPAFFTMWAMGLASFLVLACASATFAFAQYIAKQSPTALWAFGFATLISFALAAIPLLGQHYARNQLQLINDKLEECYATIT
jgi:hypothetical protein